MSIRIVEDGDGVALIPKAGKLFFEFPARRHHVARTQLLRAEASGARGGTRPAPAQPPQAPPVPTGFWRGAFSLCVDLAGLRAGEGVTIYGVARVREGGDLLSVWSASFTGPAATAAWQSPVVKSLFGCGFYAVLTPSANGAAELSLPFFVVEEDQPWNGK